MRFDDSRLQYLQDATGNTTAVLVPIEVWKEMNPEWMDGIPESHKVELDKILAETKPEDYIPLEKFLKEWGSE